MTIGDEATKAGDELKYWVAFDAVDGLGPKRFSRIEQHFGSLEEAWHAPRGELRDAGISRNLLADIDDWRHRIDPDDELARLLRKGVRPIHLRSPDYPELLREAPAPPTVLYVAGELVPEDFNSVAIVGTRDATRYGLRMAHDLAYELAARGITIVSGLAKGIDTAAHRAALQAGGRTIAVLAGGVDNI